MLHTQTSEFQAELPRTTIDAIEVDEGELLAMDYAPETPYLATLGIFTCKAIAIHSPETGQGILAHLSLTPYPEVSLTHIVERYQGDIEVSNVSILQSAAAGAKIGRGWPSIEMIGEFFVGQGARSVSRDLDRTSVDIFGLRGMALHLLTGEVTDLNYQSPYVFHQANKKPERIKITPEGDADLAVWSLANYHDATRSTVVR